MFREQVLPNGPPACHKCPKTAAQDHQEEEQEDRHTTTPSRFRERHRLEMPIRIQEASRKRRTGQQRLAVATQLLDQPLEILDVHNAGLLLMQCVQSNSQDEEEKVVE